MVMESSVVKCTMSSVKLASILVVTQIWHWFFILVLSRRNHHYLILSMTHHFCLVLHRLIIFLGHSWETLLNLGFHFLLLFFILFCFLSCTILVDNMNMKKASHIGRQESPRQNLLKRLIQNLQWVKVNLMLPNLPYLNMWITLPPQTILMMRASVCSSNSESNSSESSAWCIVYLEIKRNCH